jgi:GTP cyclohydrolase IA
MAKKIESINNGTGLTQSGYNKIETWNADDIKELSALYYKVLGLIGEDPEREGLKGTPQRVAKALHFLTMGYNQNACQIINSAKFKEDYKQMVLVKDIDLYSMCEHHMLPFFGKAHVAYIPDGYITGLSKIARVVEAFSRRLQVQERLTTQILECINDCLSPVGVAVVIEAQHMCMQIRGIQKQNSVTTTSAFTGIFLDNIRTREEFMHLIGTRLH